MEEDGSIKIYNYGTKNWNEHTLMFIDGFVVFINGIKLSVEAKTYELVGDIEQKVPVTITLTRPTIQFAFWDEAHK